jgi:hypothetical protein
LSWEAVPLASTTSLDEGTPVGAVGDALANIWIDGSRPQRKPGGPQDAGVSWSGYGPCQWLQPLTNQSLLRT